MRYKREKIKFTASEGKVNLHGELMLPPESEPEKCAVVCHPHPGMGGTMNNYVVASLGRCFADNGYAVIRFDFRSVGMSPEKTGKVGEEEDVFHVDVIVSERTSALFALRPRAEFSLVPEQVLREAGIPYDAEWKLEKKADGVEFRTNPVVIPSLRLGRFVSTDIEALVLPADVRNLAGFLAENAFPNFRIEVQPGGSVARLRPVR